MQWQIVTNNADATEAFYRDVFGWKITARNALGHRQVDTSEGGLKGGLRRRLPLQVSCSYSAACRMAKERLPTPLKIIIPATTLPDGDVMAVLVDPAAR